MPGKTILEIPIEEQERMLGELRQARYGYLLSLHILLLCAQGRTPSEIASFLFCSRKGRLSHRRGLPKREDGTPMVRCLGRLGAAHTAELAPVFARAVEADACGLWLVPHAVELRHARAAIGGYSRLPGVARDRPAHAARLGLPLSSGRVTRRVMMIRRGL